MEYEQQLQVYYSEPVQSLPNIVINNEVCAEGCPEFETTVDILTSQLRITYLSLQRQKRNSETTEQEEEKEEQEEEKEEGEQEEEKEEQEQEEEKEKKDIKEDDDDDDEQSHQKSSSIPTELDDDKNEEETPLRPFSTLKQAVVNQVQKALMNKSNIRELVYTNKHSSGSASSAENSTSFYPYEKRIQVHYTNRQYDNAKIVPLSSIRQPLNIYILFDLHNSLSSSFLKAFAPLVKTKYTSLFHVHLLPLLNVYKNIVGSIVCQNTEDRQCSHLYLWLCSLNQIKKVHFQWKFTSCFLEHQDTILSSIHQCFELVHIQDQFDDIKQCMSTENIQNEINYSFSIKEHIFYDANQTQPSFSVNGHVYPSTTQDILSIVCQSVDGALPPVCHGPPRMEPNEEYVLTARKREEKEEKLNIDLYLDLKCENKNMLVSNDLTWLLRSMKYISMIIHELFRMSSHLQVQIHPLGSLQYSNEDENSKEEQLECLLPDPTLCYIAMAIECANHLYSNSSQIFFFDRCLLSYVISYIKNEYSYRSHGLDYVESCADAVLFDANLIFKCINQRDGQEVCYFPLLGCLVVVE